MTDCDCCAKGGPIYRATCHKCTVRRLARLPRPSIGVVIRDLRAREGDAAAEALKIEVAVEHARLSAIGQL